MPDEAERQKRLAAQMILDSESLTDDLEDAAAKHLLNWGVALAERLAIEAAGDDVEPSVGGLRRLIKRVNNLVAGQATLTDGEFAVELDELAAMAGQLLDLHIQSQTASQSLLAERNRLDDAALAERITALLTPQGKEFVL